MGKDGICGENRKLIIHINGVGAISEQRYSSVPSSSCRNNTNAQAPNNQNRSEAVNFTNLSYVINEYKTHIIVNLSDNVRKQKCIRFLNQITNHKEVKDLYDAFGFVDELRGLEREYFTSKNQNEFEPFLKSFRQRIMHSDQTRGALFYDLHDLVRDILYLNDDKGSIITDLKAYMERITSEKIKNFEALESSVESQTETPNPELSKAIMELKRDIQSELVLDSCKRVMKSVKQHYFPFAPYLFLPINFSANDRNSLRDTCIKQFKNIMKTIKERNLPAEFYNHIRNSVSFDGTDQPPFYTWKYDSIKNEIENLLSGEKITIKSDIANGVNQNAVKFNEIALRFKLHNSSKQNEFEQKFLGLEINLQMKGSFDYRCNERIYPISVGASDDENELNIYYAGELIDNILHYVRWNMAFDKIRKNPAFLSPYGEWNIQLTGDRQINIDVLKDFMNEEIDLELHGHGLYLPHRQFSDSICNNQLDKYYASDSILPNNFPE